MTSAAISTAANDTGMNASAHRGDALHPAVRAWLIVTAALIFIMVLVGGATRLTESGLSIVEWKVVTGTLPPLSEAQWNKEFEAYQKIPQYSEVNRGMSLAEFKTIFWWEWAHRLLGRLIGAVFLGQRLDTAAVAGIALIAAGVVVINLFSGAGPH